MHHPDPVKRPVDGADFPKDAIVGGGIRSYKPYIATGDSVIQVGDKVVVFALPSAFYKLNKFFNS